MNNRYLLHIYVCNIYGLIKTLVLLLKKKIIMIIKYKNSFKKFIFFNKNIIIKSNGCKHKYSCDN